MQFLLGTSREHKVLFCLLQYLSFLRLVCCYYRRISWGRIILFMVLLKEMRMRAETKISFFVSGVTQRNEKTR